MSKAAIAIMLATVQGDSALAQSITVESGPCLGECPVFRFEATAAGRVFEGHRGTLLWSFRAAHPARI
ncbi:hypothetical protein [Sinorhizobium meliloti]|uniref:hypothetical protein n=1 Tax=Rhizobium meliloti TaxID=382 RepID=UPI0013E35321|nr:hypothetical protein [Sinorhizobium meliloti]